MAHPIENLNEFSAEEAGNMEEIEMQFAVKTVEHLEAYERLITGVPPSKIKLTSMDDEIVADLYTRFPEFKENPRALLHISEDEFKSPANKIRWREFIQGYQESLTEYNFGTLVRKDADSTYSEENSMLVTRAQFVAIEIVRNRNGLNDKVYEDAQAAKAAAKAQK
ncbi:hypothetical protein CspeluHIS016_0109490 [Cutaneotrichosporon spelunceum]|uniref:Polysaccharide biosynthesis domain-containing protein n=1 Tax=Cutaneotrichosporon spelunceum TaxID=1672016 RepID=A0AAD3TPM7_9TREE|nr:hypothetical protein CspeluHIS016_0109490 [Cutaneotrichosporon spelunceum]